MLVSLFILSIALVFAQDIKPADSPLEFRRFVWDWAPLENRLSAGGVKITVDVDGQNTSASADVDFAGFKFIANRGSQVAVGFAGLAAHAEADWKPGADGTGKLIYSIAGAWAEIVLGFSHIFLYEEKNGEAGFQYNLGDKVWTCQEEKLDCVIAGSPIAVTDLYYSAVSYTGAACPSSAGYNTDCRVWTITTIGYLEITRTTPVFEFTFDVSNQKVLSGNQQIGPDYGKISWKITYPWTTQDKTKANVGIAGYVGGKAGTAGIVGGSFHGKNGYIFKGDNDKAAVIAWDGTATLGTNSGNKDSAVYVNGISGDSILKYDLTGADPASILIITGWKVSVGLAAVGGWTAELVLLSWDGVGPDSVVYDPTFGMASTSEFQAAGSSFLMPSFLSLVCTLVLSRLF